MLTFMALTAFRAYLPQELKWPETNGWKVVRALDSDGTGTVAYRKGALVMTVTVGDDWTSNDHRDLVSGVENAGKIPVWTRRGWKLPREVLYDDLVAAAYPQSADNFEGVTVGVRMFGAQTLEVDSAPLPDKDATNSLMRGIKLCTLGWLAGQDLVGNRGSFSRRGVPYVELTSWANVGKCFVKSLAPGMVDVNCGGRSITLFLGRSISGKFADLPKGVVCSRRNVIYAPFDELEAWRSGEWEY